MSTKVKELAKHPVSLWTALVITVGPALVDRYLIEPDQRQEDKALEQTLEEEQWAQLQKAFEVLQERNRAQGEKLQRLEVELAHTRGSIQHLLRGRRSAARETLEEVDLPSPGPEPISRSIELPDFAEMQRKALEAFPTKAKRK